MSANRRSLRSGLWSGFVAAVLLSACAQEVSLPAAAAGPARDAAATRKEVPQAAVTTTPAKAAQSSDPSAAAPGIDSVPAAAARPRETPPAPADAPAGTMDRTSRQPAPAAERPAPTAAADLPAAAEASNRGIPFALGLFGAVLLVMVAWMARFESSFPKQMRELREQFAQQGRPADSVAAVPNKAGLAERLLALEQRVLILEGRGNREASARTSSVPPTSPTSLSSRSAMHPVSARPNTADARPGTTPDWQPEMAQPRGPGEVEPADVAFLSANARAQDYAATAMTRVEAAAPAEQDPAVALQRLLVGIQMAADIVLAEGKVRDVEALTQEIAARLTPEHERALRAQGWRVGAHGASSGPDFSNPKVLSVTKSDGRGWLIPNRRVVYNYNFISWFSGDGRQWPNFRQAADCTVDAAGYVSVQQHCLGKL